jgi:hypothetical protein
MMFYHCIVLIFLFLRAPYVVHFIVICVCMPTFVNKFIELSLLNLYSYFVRDCILLSLSTFRYLRSCFHIGKFSSTRLDVSYCSPGIHCCYFYDDTQHNSNVCHPVAERTGNI